MKAGSRSWRRRERRPTGSLLPKPVVAESLLDRLIDTRHEVRMDGPNRPRNGPANGFEHNPQTGVHAPWVLTKARGLSGFCS